MKKLITAIFVIGLFLPVIAEAGYLPEGRRRNPRCKKNRGVVVCRVKKPKKCTLIRPCIPKGYYRTTLPLNITLGKY
tara:strand:+ start:198 stop:428 length:231 start_codon:yes stop_codon:yes gene_type:complete